MKNFSCIAIFIGALVASTSPCPSQWKLQPVPPELTMLLGVDFLNTNIGLAAGYTVSADFHGKAVYSTNGGLN